MSDCWLTLQGLSRKMKECSFNMRALTEPVHTSVAGIIIASTGVFSEMNFSEDVYAKDSKDTFARRLNQALFALRCGWLIAGPRIARTKKDGG